MSKTAERPGKIVCVGRNYSEHAKELGNEVPKEPLIFLKPPSSVIADGAAIRLPSLSKQVEHEAEIGVIVGARLSNADESKARESIAAIVAVNDVTARDLQKTDGQWTRAKGFDTFCPIGEPSSSYPALDNLTVVCRVNGKETQRGSSADMVFSIPMLLSYISRIMTLEPGDLVATGTPAGVGKLNDGDVVEVEIVGVSKVSNPVKVAENDESPIGKFVAKRGPGIHHICFAVDDLDGTLERCRRSGLQLIDDKPRIGAEGKRIAFIHPRSTGGILVELSEH